MALESKVGANAEVDIALTQMVWPGVLTMPERDRAVIAASANACDLRAEPQVPRLVLACLRRGARSATVMKPLGVEDMPAELERLVERAENRGAKSGG